MVTKGADGPPQTGREPLTPAPAATVAPRALMTRSSDHSLRPIPEKIGHYRLKEFIGQGGYKTVYRGVHRWLRIAGAVSIMRHAVPDEKRALFLREARRIATLRGHPAIAEVRDFGFYRDPESREARPYFVTDYIPGSQTIIDFASTNKLDQAGRLRLFAQVCDGVRHAHDLRVLHLDLKPANILVRGASRGRPPEPRIIDFGLARAADPEREIPGHPGLSGTIPYMSPEQTDTQAALDDRSDVYSLGVVLYELLCGYLPYELRGKTSEQAIQTIRLTPPDFESGAPRALPFSIRAVLQKALHKAPESRYANAGALLADLKACMKGEAPAPAAPWVRAWYGLRLRVTRHPVLTAAAVLLTSMLATVAIGVPLITLWTPLGDLYIRYFGPASPIERFERVVMIARTEETAARLGVPPADEPAAFRRYYGELLKRIATVDPLVVGFDIIFVNGEENLEALAKPLADEIQALVDRHIPVIVPLDTSASAAAADDVRLSRLIYTAASHWGHAHSTVPNLCNIDLVSKREGSDPEVAFAMAAVAAAWEPLRRAQYTPEYWTDTLAVEFYQQPTSAHDPRIVDPNRTRRPRVSAVRYENAARPGLDQEGRPARDAVAKFIFPIPPESVCDEAVIPMERLLGPAADQTALRECHGKVVLIYNAAQEQDLFPYEGKERRGTHALAAAIEMLLQGQVVRMPDAAGEWTIVVAGAALGMVLPIGTGRRRAWWPAWGWRTRGLVWVGAALAVTIVCAAATAAFLYIVHPLIPVFAMLTAAGLSLAVALIASKPGLVEEFT